MAMYVAFYSNQQIVDIDAPTSLDAQSKAVARFQAQFPRRKIKSYEVTVSIFRRDDGTTVLHNGGSL